MSIVRIGLAETDGFSDGYDRIFGKKKDEDAGKDKKSDDKKDDTQAQAETKQPAK